MTEELTTDKRNKIGKRAGVIGIITNIALFLMKLTAGLISGSVSIVADAVNNLTDAGSSILVMLGYIISAKPADREHPYGHARMEYLCGLFVSIIVTVLGIELFKSSIENIIDHNEAVSYSILSIIIMAVSICAKIALALFYRHTGRIINSQTLSASAADSVGDVCATSAVILGILLTPLIGPIADGIFGCLIAAYIFIMGIRLIIDSSNTLLGTPPDIELVKTIVGKIRSYDGVLGIHDLVIHNYGPDQYFATVHVEMDASRNILELHDIIDNIEIEFREKMGLQLVIHLDPVNINDERTNTLRDKVRYIIDSISQEFSSPLSFHDFRAVFGNTHINLIFDIVVANDFPLTNEELVETVRHEIQKQLGETYKSVITIDRDYKASSY